MLRRLVTWSYDRRRRVVALAAGLHASRIDGSPLEFNKSDTYSPDILVCRPDLTEKVLAETTLPGQMMPLLQAFPRDTHPMPVLSAGVSLFGTHGDDLDIDDPKAVDLATARLLGRGPTLAAAVTALAMGCPRNRRTVVWPSQ